MLDALEQALYDRPRGSAPALVHHSDRGVQYVSIRYTERLAEAGIVPSVGSRGDSYDNALAESVIGLYKTEVINRRGPWRTVEAVELATLDWVEWFNNRRLLAPIGYVPPAECEEQYSIAVSKLQSWWRESHNSVSGKPGTVQWAIYTCHQQRHVVRWLRCVVGDEHVEVVPLFRTVG